jgi:glycosyltransferase involved in cell wall biosynthesis
MIQTSTFRPLASVIITSYNQFRFLPRTLASVRTQTWPHVEMIVVDDASTDETELYLRAQADIRVVRNPQNRGPSFSRNQGLLAARGQYVAFLDGDDLFLPEKLEAQVQALEDDPTLGMVYADTLFCDDQDRDLPWRYSQVRRPHPGPDIFEALAYGNFVPIHAAVTRRAALEATGGFFDEAMRGGAEDWHFWLRLAAVCRVRFQPRVLGKYRVHSSNVSQRRLTLTHSNAVVRRWLIGSPLFARLSPAAQHACYLSAAISLVKLGETSEARHFLREACRLRPLHPAAYVLTVLSGLGAERFRALADRTRLCIEWIRRTPQPFGAQGK